MITVEHTPPTALSPKVFPLPLKFVYHLWKVFLIFRLPNIRKKVFRINIQKILRISKKIFFKSESGSETRLA